MTRVLLPVFIGLVVLIGVSVVVPIYVREMLRHWERIREIDEWLEDLE